MWERENERNYKSPKPAHGHLQSKLILPNPVYPIAGKKIQIEKNFFLYAPGHYNDASCWQQKFTLDFKCEKEQAICHSYRRPGIGHSGIGASAPILITISSGHMRLFTFPI